MQGRHGDRPSLKMNEPEPPSGRLQGENLTPRLRGEIFGLLGRVLLVDEQAAQSIDRSLQLSIRLISHQFLFVRR